MKMAMVVLVLVMAAAAAAAMEEARALAAPPSSSSSSDSSSSSSSSSSSLSPTSSNGGASFCSDQNQAFAFILPCVGGGSLQTKPSAACCAGMRSLVASLSLSCMCQMLISVGGTSTPLLVRTYISRCAIPAPRNFVCKL